MFRQKGNADPMYALGERLERRDVDAAYEYLRLFKTRPDLDPVMHDLTRAVALVAADTMIEKNDE